MIATVTALCAAETACCGQTRFLLDITAGQMILTAEAPGTPGLLDALFQAGRPWSRPNGRPGWAASAPGAYRTCAGSGHVSGAGRGSPCQVKAR